jgi:Cdc6-like AAA superfamily ATPase
MKINTCLSINMIVILLLQPSLYSLYGIDLFKEPEKLKKFIIETTTVPSFSTQWFLGHLKEYTKSFIITSALSFITGFISSKFGKPYMINNAIRSALKEESEKPKVTENILKENEEIEQFIQVVLQENFTFQSVLLFGPPGTGKTTFARWLAQEIQATLYPFSEIAGVLKLKSLLGQSISPGNLLTYLVKVIETRKENPPKKIIVLFDEFDLLYKKMKNFKNLISGLSENNKYRNTIFIATTNYINDIPQSEQDRFERKIRVKYTAQWLETSLKMAIQSYKDDENFKELVIDKFKRYHDTMVQIAKAQNNKRFEYEISKLTDNNYIIQHGDNRYLPKLSLRSLQNAIRHAKEKMPENTQEEEKQAEIIAKEMYKEVWFNAHRDIFTEPTEEQSQQ